MNGPRLAAVAGVGAVVFATAFGIGFAQSRTSTRPAQSVGLAPGGGAAPTSTAAGGATPAGSATPAATGPTTSTTAPCGLTSSSGSVPIDQVCPSAGAPHFATPDAAMTYLAAAWNDSDVRRIDYVTDPNGRTEMNAMAAQMVNLRFDHCAANPAGDYTCFFRHDITPSTSPTTYPNPAGYPPGEAVFTVAPAAGPGWYLTQVIHCG